MKGRKYRYELKYVCSEQQIRQLEERLRLLLCLDPHAGADGSYTIRSLYFDDYENSAFWEKEDGTDPRKKYRFRFYDGRTEQISLEIKRKVNGKIRKDACRIPWSMAEAVMHGDWNGIGALSDPVAREFYLDGMTRLLQPKIIVEYDRAPYIYPDGNVRITFDRNIRSGAQSLKFGESRIALRPIMETSRHLMEVKFDEFLPDWIHRTLQLDSMTQTAFSKYYLCRKYSL